MGLFTKADGPTSKPKRGEDPFGNSPLTAYEKGKREWFERMGSPIVERDRYFILAGLFGLAFVALVATLAKMMPLSRVEPIVMAVDKLSGEVRPQKSVAQAFKPGENEKQFHLTRWTRALMALDINTTELALTEVYENCRGKAVQEFSDFIGKTKPIVRVRTEAGLVRTVDIKSYSPLNDQSVLIRIQTEERGINKETVRKSYAVTLHYAIDPPQTEAEVMKNPIGLFITHFSINEDLS